MRKVFSTIALILTGIALMAQGQIMSHNFDTLTTGTGVASQLGQPFTTWSNLPGGAEDPVVSSDVAVSGTNSIKISTGNDGVVHFADLSTGRYAVSFQMNIKANYLGYLNLLQDFAGSNSKWGMQIFFNQDGSAVVDAGGASAATFTYAHDTWMLIEFFIDIDDDFASLLVDNQHITSWTWSTGAQGDGTTHKLDGINFYAWADNNVNSLFYIDDFVVTEILSPEAPTNLVATPNGNDIQMNWDAPLTTIPDYYACLANGHVIASLLSATNHTETNLYPNTYIMKVRAFYTGLGFSPASNADTAVIGGGVDRDLVLLEINTGTWCGYCPGAAMGADDMEENGHEVAVIEYHNGDDYVVADATSRENYYNVTAFPTSTMDGNSGFSGGNATTSIYPSYLALYTPRENYPSVLEMDLSLTQVNPNEFNCEVTVTESNPYFENGLVLRAALTESHIPEVWGGLQEVNYVCRSMYPDAAGTNLDFTTNSSYTTTFTINTTGYVIDNCEFVVFVQHDPSKEIVQTCKVHLENLIGITEEMPTSLHIYPNPSEGIFTLDILSGKNQVYQIEVMDVHGKVVRTMQTTRSNLISKQMNLSDLSHGIYFLRITGDDDSVMKQIQLK